MRFYQIFLSCLLFCAAAIAQQTLNSDSLIHENRVALDLAVDNWNEQDMKDVRAKFERIISITDKPALAHYYVAYASYNLNVNQQSQGNSDEAEKYLDNAIEHLKKAIDLDASFAEAFALLSSCYGMKIGITPIKGIYLGPRSGVAISKALELAPENPRIHLIDGIGKFHSPSMFGGGLDKAEVALKKAAECFQTFQPASPLLPDWGHESPFVWLGRIAIKMEKWDAAKQYFEQALEIKPNHGYVKYVLMPQVEKKRQAQAASDG